VARPCPPDVDLAESAGPGVPYGVDPMDAVGGGRIRSALQVVAIEIVIP
jgi:hypothetical protein